MKPSNSVFGSRGDFITSPEISQVFGEVRAFFAVAAYDENDGHAVVAWYMAPLHVDAVGCIIDFRTASQNTTR